MTKIGFIGTGTMGGRVAQVVAKNLPDSPLYLANRTPEKAVALSKQLKGIFSNNQIIAQECSVIFLAVKPQMLDALLEEIAPLFAQRTQPFLLVSMLAGVKTETIAQKAPGAQKIIRMMPNTPLSLGCGVVQYCGHKVTQEDLATFASLLQGAGLVDLVLESQMDAASAISGSGPAFCALMIEALADGGVHCGLPRDKALAYAAQTLIGTGHLLLEEGLHPGQIKDGVCSPGGTTIRGIAALEQQGFRNATMEAVIQTYLRATQLG